MSSWILPDGTDCVQNGIPTIRCIVPIYHIIVSAAVTLVGTVSVILILAASIKYVTSGGGKAVDEAKNMLTYAIIGLLLVLGSFFIVGLISGFTGVRCLMSFGFDSCQ